MNIANRAFVPSWPKERDLACYEEFMGVPFTDVMRSRDLWIDIGCRSGKALVESKKKISAKLVGVNAHPAKVLKGFTHLWATLPEDPYLYNKYKGSAHLVTDIYGAVSYCYNPLEALIYEASLLSSNGALFSYMLEARFGPKETWKRMAQFFSRVTQQKIIFTPVQGRSGSGRPLRCLRVSIYGKCQTDLNLDELFLRAQHQVGIPKKEKIIFQPLDKSAVQWGVLFQKICRT